MRKFLHEVLVDQLPVLQHVQRYMDELTIMRPPEASKMSGALLMEQVPAMREALGKVFNWDEEARRCAQYLTSPALQSADDLKECDHRPVHWPRVRAEGPI